MSDAIVLEQVSVAFRTAGNTPRYALRDLSLRIRAGSFVGIVGNNGSGKSTLAQVLAGTLPTSQGRVSTSGRVAMVFQNPDTQIIGETIAEDINFGLENFAVPASEMPSIVATVLHQVGLDVSANQPLRQLSGGQRQLHCIAAALALQPAVLVFDEATAMLNPPLRRRIFEIARQLAKAGTTVLWITQWLEEAAETDRIVAVNEGNVAFDGSPVDFFYGCPNAGEERQIMSPCQHLGWPLPFAVQTAQILRHRGMLFQFPPLTLADVAVQVTDA